MADTIPDVDLEVEAIAAARSFCGWHVSPPRTETVTLDGPGGDLLVLRSMRVTEVDEIAEDAVLVDPDNVSWSTRGLIRKLDRTCWTCRYGGIVVTYTHGFTEEDAADFWAAVRSYFDRLETGGFSGGQREVVGPFAFGATTAAGSVFSEEERAGLNRYRLEPSP